MQVDRWSLRVQSLTTRLALFSLYYISSRATLQSYNPPFRSLIAHPLSAVTHSRSTYLVPTGYHSIIPVIPCFLKAQIKKSKLSLPNLSVPDTLRKQSLNRQYTDYQQILFSETDNPRQNVQEVHPGHFRPRPRGLRPRGPCSAADYRRGGDAHRRPHRRRRGR